MMTVVETPAFSNLWPDYWTEDELGEFVTWLAAHPDAGDVIRGSGGCRKIRWSRPGMGKSGGVRIIYYNQRSAGLIYLLLLYAKGVRDTIDGKTLNKIRRAIHGETG